MYVFLRWFAGAFFRVVELSADPFGKQQKYMGFGTCIPEDVRARSDSGFVCELEPPWQPKEKKKYYRSEIMLPLTDQCLVETNMNREGITKNSHCHPRYN
mmetsp:Transcript_22895/g.55582  ORF Transcript_22895/g.55582 Transcript_22895/m.55582 type:complete len:100 (-) Transcript_22895:108-407(-)